MRKMNKKNTLSWRLWQGSDWGKKKKKTLFKKKNNQEQKQNQKPLVVQEKQRRNRKKEKMGVQAWKKMYLVSVEDTPGPGSPVERSL